MSLKTKKLRRQSIMIAVLQERTTRAIMPLTRNRHSHGLSAAHPHQMYTEPGTMREPGGLLGSKLNFTPDTWGKRPSSLGHIDTPFSSAVMTCVHLVAFVARHH